MEYADFEEKQYESALSQELTAGHPTAYPSGQVLEALVGYDVALRPGGKRIWELLDAGFPPGALLSAGLWAACDKQPSDADLPEDTVSLILQMKRPHRLDHWRAGQHHFWKGPYFRFYIFEDQHAQLGALETAVRGRALVRYASPAFLTFAALYRYQRNRTIADESTFVSPSVLTGHRLWSYAGPGTKGFANPEGEPAPADTRETLLGAAGRIAERATLREHVAGLAAALPPVDLSASDWAALFPDGIDEERLPAVEAWARVMAAVTAGGAEWFVMNP